MAGTITTSFQKPYLAWGLACLAWFDLLWICSLDVIRSRAYNLFKTVHCVSAVFILVTVYMHVPSIAPFVFAAVAVYAFDTAIRLFKTRLVTGTLTAQGKMTKLTLPLGAGWRAGHHVRVRVLSTRIGVLRWAEAHPFTVASAPGGGSQLELLIQPAGTWTNQLGAIARGEFSDNNEKGVDMGVPVRVVVEGPYGGVGHARVAGCTGALIVAGGSGMSFALGALDELAHHPGHMRHAQIVWSVPEPSALAPFLDRLRALLKAAERRGLDVRVRVHYTRALQDPDLRLFLPPGVSIRAGRPPLPKILHSATERALRAVGRASGKPSGFWVGVCGPEGLSESVARAVSGVDPALRVSVGGVEFHRE
jgi:ferric-chelate reductase